MARLTPVDFDPFAASSGAAGAKLTPVDFDPFAAPAPETEQGRSLTEFVTDTGTGIGANALGMVGSLLRETNTKTPWSDTPGGDLLFRTMETVSGLMRGSYELMPEAIRNNPVTAQAKKVADAASLGLAAKRAAIPADGRLRSEFVDAFSDKADEFAADARASQSPTAKAIRQTTAEKMGEGFLPTARYLVGEAASGNPGPVMQALESLVPSLAAGGGVSKVFGAAAGAAPMLGTMAVMEGTGAGSQARQAVMTAPEEELAQYPLYQALVRETRDPGRARLALADTAGSVGTMVGTTASAGLMGIGQRLGLNVVEDAVAGRASRGMVGGRVANALRGSAAESSGEAIEEGANQISSNVGEQAAGAPTGMLDGVGGAMAMGGLIGAPSGLVTGALQKPQPLQPGEDLLNGGTVAAPPGQSPPPGVPPAARAPVNAEDVIGAAPAMDAGGFSALDAALAAADSQPAAEPGNERSAENASAPAAVAGSGLVGQPSVAPAVDPGQVGMSAEATAPGLEDYTPRLAELRRLKDQRTPEQAAEYMQLLETDRITTKVGGQPIIGVQNFAKFADDEADGVRKPFVLISDADNFKRINDTLGHDFGDQVIRAIGETLRDAMAEIQADAYHRSGDEFLAAGDDPEAMGAAARRANEMLGSRTITVSMPDGGTRQLSGVQFSFGIGRNSTEAEAGLHADKQQRAAAGLRTERGPDRRAPGPRGVAGGLGAQSDSSPVAGRPPEVQADGQPVAQPPGAAADAVAPAGAVAGALNLNALPAAPVLTEALPATSDSFEMPPASPAPDARASIPVSQPAAAQAAIPESMEAPTHEARTDETVQTAAPVPQDAQEGQARLLSPPAGVLVPRIHAGLKAELAGKRVTIDQGADAAPLEGDAYTLLSRAQSRVRNLIKLADCVAS